MGRGSGEQLLVLLGSKYSFPCIILPVEFHHRDMVNQPFLSRQFEQVLETGQLTVNAGSERGAALFVVLSLRICLYSSTCLRVICGSRREPKKSFRFRQLKASRFQERFSAAYLSR